MADNLLFVMSDRADLYKVETVVLCRWEENLKVSWFPAWILKHPVPGQSEGSWKVQWLREASGTGTGPTGSTERFDPWINDDGENLCSTVVNKEDFKVLPGVGTNHPTEPSQPSASSNLTDAESAEQQVASKLVPQVSSNAGLGDSSFVWLYFTRPTFKSWKG